MLMPIKKILYATDFSDYSYEALNSAIALASHFGAELCLVHVIAQIPRPTWCPEFFDEKEMYEPGLAEYEDALYISAQQKLHDVIEKLVPAEIKSKIIVRRGDAAVQIALAAEDERVNLVVLSTHGLTGWRQITLGSVAEKVVRLSPRPVLTIRAPCDRC